MVMFLTLQSNVTTQITKLNEEKKFIKFSNGEKKYRIAFRKNSH